MVITLMVVFIITSIITYNSMNKAVTAPEEAEVKKQSTANVFVGVRKAESGNVKVSILPPKKDEGSGNSI